LLSVKNISKSYVGHKALDNISVDEGDGSSFSNLRFIVQVRNRLHLADLIRNLRKISKINRINRVKSLN